MDKTTNKEDEIQKRTERPDSIYLGSSSNDYKGICCEKLLKNFHLTETQIQEILSKNNSKQIKIMIRYIDELYKVFQDNSILLEPNISTYIYEVFTDEVVE